MIQRDTYIQQLANWRDQRLIKVVTGVRRCGKSTLFCLYIDYLKAHDVEVDQILSINLEDIENEYLLDHHELYKYILHKLHPDKTTYVFIDEIQNCPSFERVVNSLFLKENIDIYITGSNAFMLSGELATLLSGRYIQIETFPLSFEEYCSVSNGESIAKKFNNYMKFGAFPYIAQMGNNIATSVQSYLDSIYNTIIIKDIMKRTGFNNYRIIERIVKCLASSIGSPISIKKITDTLISSGLKISQNTVDDYVYALTNSYIFYKSDRYDIKGKQFLKTFGKYYIVDTGLRNILVKSDSSNIGHIIENIVFFELLRQGAKVNIGKLYGKEVDFVVDEGDGLSYYQVAASVLDETNLKRELEPLLSIRDSYPKYLLTLDEIGEGKNYDGIKQLNLIDWLLKKYPHQMKVSIAQDFTQNIHLHQPTIY